MSHPLTSDSAHPGRGRPVTLTYLSPRDEPTLAGDTCVLRLAGDLDADVCPTLEVALAPLLQGPQPTRLVLDLSGVSATDSTGLGLLVRTQAALRKRGGTVALRRCSPPVARALEVTCLIRLFEVLP